MRPAVLAMHRPVASRHGNLCTCRLLAGLVGCEAKVVRFEYCRRILMSHWKLECNHGCPYAEAPPKEAGKWHDIGPIDAIKAILIKNE